MSTRRDDDDIDALEYLRDASKPPAAQKPRPAARPAPPTPAQPAAEKPAAKPTPQPPHRATPVKPAAAPPAPRRPAADLAPLEIGVTPPAKPVAPVASRRRNATAANGVPRFRCLNCGYPLAGADELTCSECGRTFERATLEHWSSPEECERFRNVLWFVAAALFLKLFIAPPTLLWVARVGACLLVGWGGLIAGRDKGGSVGGYYAKAAVVSAFLMFFTLWSESAIAYYTLDMLAGTLLVLALLYDPDAGPVFGSTGTRTTALVLLFVTPLLAVGGYIAEQATATTASGMSLTSQPPSFLGFEWFGFIVPFFASAGVWLFAWFTLRATQRRLFPPTDDA